MGSARILIVGTDEDDVRALRDAVAAAGADVAAVVADPAAAVQRADDAAAIVADGSSLGADATSALLAAAAAATPPLPCIVAVRAASVEEAVDLMRRGAFAVVPLPLDADEFGLRVEQALRHRDLCVRNGQLERSLEAHERLAMIGKLAAGVAHELNNPLDGVLRYVQLASDTLPKDAQQIPYLAEARRGLRRMADIVRDLLQFSRNASVEAAEEDGERMARDAVEAVVASVPEDRRVRTVYEFPRDGVAFPRVLFQVLGNLARNAVDAMPRGGCLRVAAAVEGDALRIEVADDGTGIPEEIRERIFEPFFTTKEVGRGTGLGLPICLRIVERLGGTFSVESEVGEGTVVVIELPRRRPAARAAAAAPSRRTEGVF